MKPIITFLVLAAALLLLGSMVLGVMVSVGSGRLSTVLMGVFVLDTAILIVIAGHMVLGNRGGVIR